MVKIGTFYQLAKLYFNILCKGVQYIKIYWSSLEIIAHWVYSVGFYNACVFSSLKGEMTRQDGVKLKFLQECGVFLFFFARLLIFFLFFLYLCFHIEKHG